MEEEPVASLEPTAEQVQYASVLEKGMYCGLLCLFVTFTLYASGIVDAYVPREKLPQHWQKNVQDYLQETGTKAGWKWVTMVGYGDFLNYIGIAILAGVTVPCYLSIIPLLLKKGDFAYVLFALLEVVILVTAASGVVSVGH